MKQAIFTVVQNERLTKNVYLMRLIGDTGDITAPGQFVNIRLDGLFLRRPISVCDREGEKLTLVYKTVGRGTEQMSHLQPGEKLDLLTGLGNGYRLEVRADRISVLGGGVGIPPLYWLTRELVGHGKHVKVRLGFNTREEVFFLDEFRALTSDFGVCTVDGSLGEKGFATDTLSDPETEYFYACGPLPMLKAACRLSQSGGQVSMEERMGCGFGACMGCSIETVNGPRRVCREGPVFYKEELKWTD